MCDLTLRCWTGPDLRDGCYTDLTPVIAWFFFWSQVGFRAPYARHFSSSTYIYARHLTLTRHPIDSWSHWLVMSSAIHLIGSSFHRLVIILTRALIGSLSYWLVILLALHLNGSSFHRLVIWLARHLVGSLSDWLVISLARYLIGSSCNDTLSSSAVVVHSYCIAIITVVMYVQCTHVSLECMYNALVYRCITGMLCIMHWCTHVSP